MISPLNCICLILTVVAAFFQYRVAGKESADSRGIRTARLVIVILLLLTFTSFYRDALEKADDLNRILVPIKRSLDKIEDVSATLQATVPASEPDVVAFREKLLANSAVCLEDSKGFDLQPQLIMPPCFKYLLRDQAALLRLGTVELLLVFFRATPGTHEIQERKPDLIFRFLANLREGTLELDYDRLQDRFVLRGSALKPYAWEAPGDIVSVADLENVGVEISLRPAERDSREGQERAQFESVYLDFKGAHTWKRSISRAETKRVKGSPAYPTYLYTIKASVLGQ